MPIAETYRNYNIYDTAIDGKLKYFIVVTVADRYDEDDWYLHRDGIIRQTVSHNNNDEYGIYNTVKEARNAVDLYYTHLPLIPIKVQPLNSYLKEFYSLNCHIDVLQCFNNYKKVKDVHKELTESIGCFNAAIDAGLNINDKVLVWVVGDGKYPRTGIMSTFRSKWTVQSIDPELNLDWFNKWSDYKKSLNQDVFRISLHNVIVEEFKEKVEGFSKFLIVMPHSHATIENTLKQFASLYGEEQNVTLVNLPCCKPIQNKFLTKKFIENCGLKIYSDENIMSPKNMVYVWKNINYKQLRK